MEDLATQIMDALKGLDICDTFYTLHQFDPNRRYLRETLYRKGTDLVNRFYKVAGYIVRVRYHEKTGEITNIHIEEEK